MACDLMNVGADNTCVENYAGVGNTIYLYKHSDLTTPPEYDDESAGFTAASFAFGQGKGFYQVKIEAGTGQVTSSSNGLSKGFSNVLTGRVSRDMETMSLLARTLNNTQEWGAMVPDGQGSYYVVDGGEYGTVFELASDTGTTPDSENGHTLTITGSPMKYPHPKWTGTPTLAS